MMKQVLYVLFAVCVFFGCSSAKEETPLGGIAGSVSDKTTGEPVATVSVSLTPGGKSIVTGADGTFSFASLEPGTYSVDIAKKGYNPNKTSVSVKEGEQAAAHLLIERIPAKISVDKDTLDFGSTENILLFQIVNSDYSDLDWTIIQSCSWIKEIKPSSGTLGYGKTETISIIIDRGALKAGENTNTLVVKTSDGGIGITIVAIRDILPCIQTLGATDINPNIGTAILNGEIIKNGELSYSERGFVFGTAENPTFNDSKVIVLGSSLGKFSAKVSSLTVREDIYYFRAYATNQMGTVYGENMEIPMHYITIKAAALAVQRSDLGKANVESAISMCKNSTVAGYTDWRLPTKNELMTLYTNRKSIGGFNASYYWSSSTIYEEAMWNQVSLNFEDGIFYRCPYYQYDYQLGYVRCVRSLK